MEKILYFDCFAGISGDMVVGALLDLGVDADRLRRQLEGLKLDGYQIEIKRNHKMGLWGTDFRVLLESAREHEHTYEHNDHQEHAHTHEQAHTHEHKPQPVHVHAHEHRKLQDITKLLAESHLPEKVKKRSLDIFHLIAAAEGRIHGISPDEVHFHEVGAIDSIVDVVSACICIHELGIDKVYASPLHLGEGFVHCAHGLIPVPAPAVLETLKGVAVYTTGLRSELVTPTGAAIIKNLAQSFGPIPEMRVEKIGYGLADRDLEIPNMLRVIQAQMESSSEKVWMLECNMDDMNSQYYSHLFPLFMERGALDVYLTPVIMKKNRPGICLSVLCEESRMDAMEEIIWRETTTLGIRRKAAERRVLEREFVAVETCWGPVSFKLAYHQGRLLKYAPEYEDIHRIACEHKVPLPEVHRQVMQEAAKVLDTYP